MEKILSKLEKYIIYAVVFFLPFIVAPISTNPFLLIKLAVLVFGVGLALFVKAIKVIVSGKLEFSMSNFDLAVLLFAVAYILSTIFRTTNKMEALLTPGTTTLVVGSVLLFFLINQLPKQAKETATNLFVYSGTVVAVLSLLATVGLFVQIPQLPAFLQIRSFTPEGGYLPTAVLLAVMIPLAVGALISEKNSRKKAGFIVSLAALVLGLGLSIYNILPGKPNSPRFPDFSTSWSVAIDTIKESPLLGAGPGNYLTAFNRFRPITYNNSDLWAVKFSTANSYYLTMMTETGLLGLAVGGLLILTIYRVIKRDFKEKSLVGWGFAGSASLVSLVILLVFAALFPMTATLIVALFILLSLNAETKVTTLNLKSEVTTAEGMPAAQGVASRLPALLITFPVIALVIYSGFFATRYLRAEYKFRQSINALAQNEAIRAYDTMREAININPRVDRYHASYSQVNMALANAVAQNPEITDQDRANITQLIQQAIREGKATVALNPLRAGNWELLGRIYRAIIPFAQGADAFAAQTFAQAVALDPVNPNTRIALGGIYYATGNFETAIRVLELATSTKPDLANAHYNLAFAYSEAGRIDEAINQMTLVLSLVDRDTQDYEVARQALEDMEARRGEVAKQPSESLTPPEEAPEPIITPPIELPEDAEPPESPVTPTPTPEEGEEETGTVTPQVTPTPAP
jgi:tetratricopeptide (TPR) repeat protein